VRAESPKEVAEALAKAINAGDARGALELWSEDAIVVSPDGSQTSGLDAVSGILESLVASGTRMEIDLRTIHATEQTAVATGTLTLTAPAIDGRPAFVSRGESMVVYTRGSDGAWLVSIDFPWGAGQTQTQR
jgi:uncharacterized protein (TIGR02246 family)